MPLMIEATELKGLVKDADEAHQVLIKASERWLDLQAKLFAVPADPADELACDVQAKIVKAARAKHTHAMGVVVAALRSAVGFAEAKAATMPNARTITLQGKTVEALERYEQGREVYLASGLKSDDELRAAERAFLHEAHNAAEEVSTDMNLPLNR
ncbi:hypothetical protein [Serratia proteamaculans]|uniref:hypothetical protein n=1 Tax=Serratia proteamaculans TaxID=28151 RepID=UPI003CFE88B8